MACVSDTQRLKNNWWQKFKLNNPIMIKKITLGLLFFSIMGFAFSQELEKIESYKTLKPMPSESGAKEVYDFRVESNLPVPPTLTDVLVFDLWQRITSDLKKDIGTRSVNIDLMNASIDIYLKKEFGEIAGYRPWTNWNFIRSLTKEQRTTLANEVVEYLKTNGIKDAK